MEGEYWQKCSTCKRGIAFGADYYVCSVSSCNGKRTGFQFCSMPCWERHLPIARHRDAAAVREVAPRKGSGSADSSIQRSSVGESSSPSLANPSSSGVRRMAVTPPSNPRPSKEIPQDILVVASKLKDYIRLRSEMNTSATVLPVLSDILRRLCDDAIERAREDGRKTVMDRDFE